VDYGRISVVYSNPKKMYRLDYSRDWKIPTIETPIGRTFLSCTDMDLKHALLFYDYYSLVGVGFAAE